MGERQRELGREGDKGRETEGDREKHVHIYSEEIEIDR